MTFLPKQWQQFRLGELATLKTGPFGSALHKADYKTGGIPVVNPMHIVDGRIVPSSITTISSKTAERLSEFQLQHGDVVLGRRGEMGRAAVVRQTENGWLCGTGSLIVRPGTALDSHFPQRFLASPAVVSRLEQASVGSTMVNLNQRILLNLDVPTPPLPEQKRIADKLDAVLARVDACRERLDRVPAILKRFRQSVLTATTSGKLTEEWRSSHNKGMDENAGPPEWRERPLAELCERERVITYGVIKLGTEVPDGVPCLRTSNVRWLHVETEGMKRIAPALSSEYARTILRGGEVLVNVRGTLGGVAVATPEMIGWNVSREVAVVPADASQIDPSYLAFWIGSEASQRWLSRVEKGVAYIGINIEDLRNLPVRLPPIEEQREIVDRVESLYAHADRLEARYAAARTQVERLTPALLAKAFRGELVPQDPNDEPASVLLERIRNEKALGVGRNKRSVSNNNAAPKV